MKNLQNKTNSFYFIPHPPTPPPTAPPTTKGDPPKSLKMQ